jgi:hypothetical protein
VRQCYGGPLPGDADACCHHPCLQGPSRTARDRRKKPSACTRRRRRAPSPWQGWSRCYWRRGTRGGDTAGWPRRGWPAGWCPARRLAPWRCTTSSRGRRRE